MLFYRFYLFNLCYPTLYFRHYFIYLLFGVYLISEIADPLVTVFSAHSS